MLTDQMVDAIEQATQAWDEVIERDLIRVDRDAATVAGNELARLLSIVLEVTE